MKYSFLCLCAFGLFLSGCAAKMPSSYDGFPEPSSMMAENAMLMSMAEQAANKLASLYPPAHTRLVVVRVFGMFGQNLQTSLRNKGFALVIKHADMNNQTDIQEPIDANDLQLSYVVDRVDPTTIYANFKLTDGTAFSIANRSRPQPVIMPKTTNNVNTKELTR